MRIGISLPVRDLQNDFGAIKVFAQTAEDLGFTHLRVPEQIIRPGEGDLHEPITLMSMIAGVTEKIELVPSVIMLPARQTVLVAKQAATLDQISGGRLRLGIGIGRNEVEYQSLGMDFHTRGARCEEQMQLLKQLWTQETVNFSGRWDNVKEAGIAPLPMQRPIPIWIGVAAQPVAAVRLRIAKYADGYFVLCSPEEFPGIRADIDQKAAAAGRQSDEIGAEAGVAVAGPRKAEWQQRVSGWRQIGLSHLCLRTLGGDLEGQQHIDKMIEVAPQIPLD